MYDLFVNNVISAIEAKLGAPYKVKLEKVTKNNNVSYDSFTIIDNSLKSRISPVIPVNNFYKDFCLGTNIDEIVSRIIDMYQNNKDIDIDTSVLYDLNWVKQRICYKLINTAENEELLKTVPSRKFHDLSIIYYVYFDNFEDSAVSMTIKNDYLSLWNFTENDLYECAKENTRRFFPESIFSLLNHLQAILPENISIEDDLQLNPGTGLNNFEDIMYVASNKQQNYGAGVILYPNILENFAAINNCNFWLIPSSIHEWIFVLDKENNGMDNEYDRFKDMINEVNYTQLNQMEILNNHPYYYDMHTQTILM